MFSDFIARTIDRIQRGWRLAKAATRVLRREKKLLVFPLLSSLALILVLMSFAVPLGVGKIVHVIMTHQNDELSAIAGNVLYYGLLFLFYFTNYFVIVFFNSALVACIILHFNGEEPTVSDGFQAAFSRLPQIFMWALVSATVGLALKIIFDLLGRGKLGQFVVSLIGVAWSLMTYFVVPVLVMERLGPFAAIKRSWQVMRKTWGEGLVANFGIGLIMFVLFLAALVPFFIGMMIGGWGILVGLVITLLLILFLQLVSSCLHVIVVAALYEYAAHDRAPRGFKEGTLRNAFGAR